MPANILVCPYIQAKEPDQETRFSNLTPFVLVLWIARLQRFHCTPLGICCLSNGGKSNNVWVVRDFAFSVTAVISPWEYEPESKVLSRHQGIWKWCWWIMHLWHYIIIHNQAKLLAILSGLLKIALGCAHLGFICDPNSMVGFYFLPSVGKHLVCFEKVPVLKIELPKA